MPAAPKTNQSTELDPVTLSYAQTLNSPSAELMLRDLVTAYLIRKLNPGEDLVAFNAKRELVLEMLTLAKAPIEKLIVQTIQEE